MLHCCNLPQFSIYNFFNAAKTILNMSNYLSKNSSLVSYLITSLPCVKCVSDSNCTVSIAVSIAYDILNSEIWRQNIEKIPITLWKKWNYFHFYWHIRFKKKNKKNLADNKPLKTIINTTLENCFSTKSQAVMLDIFRMRNSNGLNPEMFKLMGDGTSFKNIYSFSPRTSLVYFFLCKVA